MKFVLWKNLKYIDWIYRGEGVSFEKTIIIKFSFISPKKSSTSRNFWFFQGLGGNEICPLKKLKIYWIYRGGLALKKRLLLNFPLFPLKNHQLFFFFKISRKILSSWNSFENISKNQNFSMNSHSVIFGKA